MRDHAQLTLRDTAHAAKTFATPFAAIALLRVLVAVIGGSAPWTYLLVVPFLGFSIFFFAALALQLSGAIKRDPSNHLQLNVNGWFAWLICGALVFFFVGLLARGHDVLAQDAPRVGLLSASAWVGLILVLWFGHRLFTGRGA